MYDIIYFNINNVIYFFSLVYIVKINYIMNSFIFQEMCYRKLYYVWYSYIKWIKLLMRNMIELNDYDNNSCA